MAELPGMPQSLIQSGCTDQILRVEDVPAVMRSYVEQTLGAAESAPGLARHMPETNQIEQQLWDMVQIVRARTGHDFSPFKAGMVLCRAQRRMGLLGMIALQRCRTRLRESSVEVTALASDPCETDEDEDAALRGCCCERK
jgi:two-component system CheB/CheR fusion protein